MSGYLVRYGDKALIAGGRYEERFEPGSVEVRDNMTITNGHSTGKLLGRYGSNVEIRNDSEGVHLETTLPDTQDGRDAVTLLKMGVLKGWSAEFKAVKEALRGKTRVIQKAMLGGAALVANPAYAGSSVSLRDFEDAIKDIEVIEEEEAEFAAPEPTALLGY